MIKVNTARYKQELRRARLEEKAFIDPNTHKKAKKKISTEGISYDELVDANKVDFSLPKLYNDIGITSPGKIKNQKIHFVKKVK